MLFIVGRRVLSGKFRVINGEVIHDGRRGEWVLYVYASRRAGATSQERKFHQGSRRIALRPMRCHEEL